MSTFQRLVSYERALEAAQRLINSHFRNNPETHPHARATIPANADDDDLVIVDFIAQQQEKAPVTVSELAVVSRFQSELREIYKRYPRDGVSAVDDLAAMINDVGKLAEKV